VTRRSALTSKIESEVKLLQRHVAMLKAIMENQPIGIIRLSELLNFPQHKVRYSLRILEQEGLIKPSPEGAVTTDKLEEVDPRAESRPAPAEHEARLAAVDQVAAVQDSKAHDDLEHGESPGRGRGDEDQDGCGHSREHRHDAEDSFLRPPHRAEHASNRAGHGM
jgi:predicted transcriptional regulator